MSWWMKVSGDGLRSRRGARRRPRLEWKPETLEARLVLYAQSAHVDFANLSTNFFRTEFGLDRLARLNLYSQIASGAFDEDEIGANPFGENSTLNHPSIRHFWAHSIPGFARAPDDGLYLADSAPNRSQKYFTGGVGFAGGADGDWGQGGGLNAASAGEGITALMLQSGQEAKAAYWLGHVMHLLQDMAVPAHSHADPHLDVAGVSVDADPYHDWIDGHQFSIIPNPVTDRWSNFNDFNTNRRAQYYPQITTDSLTAIRSPEEIQNGLGGSALYTLFLQTADTSARYDTKDYDGSVDGGSVRGSESLYSAIERYSRFTEAVLNSQARVLVPLTVDAGAELLRYFYSTFDQDLPAVDLSSTFTSTNEASPQSFATDSFEVTAVGSDQDTGDSGVGKDLFELEYREKRSDGTWGDWRPLESSRPDTEFDRTEHFTDGGGYRPAFQGKSGALASVVFHGLPGGQYSFRARGEDGAGNVSDWSDTYYVRIGSGELNVIEVIDRSGSMSGTKLTQAKQAATLFAELLNLGDRLGVVMFGSSASTVFSLATIADTNGSVLNQAKTAIAGITSSGSTAIGQGLQLAGTQLAGAGTAKKAIILLSDGEENVTPYAQTVLNNGGVSADTIVYTIGLGSGADAALMQSIAQQRGGQYFFSPTPGQLAQIYDQLASTVTGGQELTRTSGTLTQGQSASTSFQVSGAETELTARVTWPGSLFNLELIAPDGRVIRTDGTGAGSDVRVISGGTYQYIRVVAPQAGTWRMSTTAVQVDANGEPFELAALVKSSLIVEDLPRSERLPPGSMPFQVRISDVLPILGLRIQATVPGNAPATLYDDGLHGDGAANDGVYGGNLGFVRSGSATVSISASAGNVSFFQRNLTTTFNLLDPIRMYRGYNPTVDAHLFTTNQIEFQSATRRGYRDEANGQSGFALLPSSLANTLPVYRLYNLKSGQHYYTTSSGERDALVAINPPPVGGSDNRTFGWRYERIEGYINTAPTVGATEVFRLYNRISGVHLFTEVAAMRDAVLANFPGVWEQHGSLGFGYAISSGGLVVQPATASADVAVAFDSALVPVSAGDETPAEDGPITNVASLIAIAPPSPVAAESSGVPAAVELSPPLPVRRAVPIGEASAEEIDGVFQAFHLDL